MRRRYDFDVIDENTDDIDIDTLQRNKNSIHSVPFYNGLLLLGILVGVFGAVQFIDGILPKPLNIEDEKTHPDAFIAERAQKDLKLLTDIGPKIVGSQENEIQAVNFLKREIDLIIQQSNKNQKVELDIQVVTGSYFLNSDSSGKINYYGNVQNVVVKLYAKDESNHSVLVNSHFDTVPTSPGGSDDGINVVAMLEILRKLSKSQERPLHNIIFLFNGAEESALQASHGFITQHKWANECEVLINLEAAGHGGKIVLFQSGPERPWLMKYYNMVPHPYGQAAGEEIFQSGIIPSDTDFRIFRDYGNLVGIDMAFFKNGYRYHTKFDDFTHIPLGSYQHVGDNSLFLVKSFANAPELLHRDDEIKSVVFFDVLGWFMISYSTTTAAVLNYITVLLSFGVLYFAIKDFNLGTTRNTVKYLCFMFLYILLGWILAAVAVFLIAYTLDKLNYSMSWYGHPWLIFGLYVAPTIAFSGVTMFFIDNKRFVPLYSLCISNKSQLSLNIRSQFQAHSVRILWTLLLLAGTIVGIRSSYVVFIAVAFNTTAFFLIHAFRLQHSIRAWQIIYITSMIIPVMFLMYSALTTFSLFIPITGRMGSNKNPETLIGIMAYIYTIFILSPLIALVTLLRDSKYFFMSLGFLFVTCFVIVCTPLGFPYNGDSNAPTPQRHWFLHTSRIFYNENGTVNKNDSGVFFLNMDRNSPSSVKDYVKDINNAVNIDEDCKKYLVCGLPLSHPKMLKIMEYSTWVPGPQPQLDIRTNLKVNSKLRLNSTIVRYDIDITGPSRTGVYFQAKENMSITSINLMDSIPVEFQNGRPLYFINSAFGVENSGINLNLDVQTPEDFEGPTLELVVTGIYVEDKKNVKMFTPYYQNMIKQFPDWTDLTAWLGSYTSYIL